MTVELVTGERRMKERQLAMALMKNQRYTNQGNKEGPQEMNKRTFDIWKWATNLRQRP